MSLVVVSVGCAVISLFRESLLARAFWPARNIHQIKNCQFSICSIAHLPWRIGSEDERPGELFFRTWRRARNTCFDKLPRQGCPVVQTAARAPIVFHAEQVL